MTSFTVPFNQGELRGASAHLYPTTDFDVPAKLVDTIDKINISPYILTKYEVIDYVLRRFLSTKIGDGNQNKYSLYSWGPCRDKSDQYQISTGYISYGTLFDLTNGKEYFTTLPTCNHFTSTQIL